MNVLLYFLKYPEKGRVKTRLGAEIGFYESAELYKNIVESQLESIKSEKYCIKIFYHPSNYEEKIKNWLGKIFEYRVQNGNTLGEKMDAAFKRSFKEGAEKTVIIGSDSPLVDSDKIENAFCMLNSYDCVIGPSEDGGYYLLGIKNDKYNEKIFLSDIKWSTSEVFNETINIIKTLKILYKVLPEELDIDSFEDLKRFYYISVKNGNNSNLVTMIGDLIKENNKG